MSFNIAIEVKNISKCYFIYKNPKYRLIELIVNRFRKLFNKQSKKYHTEYWALNKIDFKINKGDSVGIVGRNGAGKSTLLQMLTGTLTPTSGEIIANGRIAALLELGAGFNPEFTGVENIYMNASILGLTKQEIDESFNKIIEFADIGDFVNQPVKTYSSGMYVRLAFAVAANVKPDILIIDEALAVGDIRFQVKCLKYMNQLKENGTTILFVSHSPEQVKRFCNKAIWIEKGCVKEFGTSTAVCDRYNDFMNSDRKEENSSDIHIHSRQVNVPASIKEVNISSTEIKTHSLLELKITYEVFDDKFHGLLVGAAIYSNDRQYIFGANTALDKIEIQNTKGIHVISYVLPSLPLLPGTYHFDVGIMGENSLVGFDYKNEAASFSVTNDYTSEGIVEINHNWKQ
jgi:ABC-type polysaccharide/polyol phosphate transport system ATPase subunit